MLNSVNTNSSPLWAPVNTGGKVNIDLMQGVNAPIVLKRDALASGAVRLPGGGLLNAHVFKAEGFTSENPVMLVKGTNTCGSPFEVEININDLNKNRMSFIEMFALDGYITASTGNSGGIVRAASHALMHSDVVADGFTQFNLLPAFNEALEAHRQNRNWDAAVWLEAVMNSFINHFSDRD
ncbi:MAG: hypothetical protein FWC16_06680 [Defluviitaleaceae bacterium]|nr:hypothetical protein [Defluviitaleaceae bacterium]MCL2274596.1 hypothetical protein [Defluviitaleaceae bacterium]